MANDLWITPPEVIDYIENRFGKIQIDLCASDEGYVCNFYITEQENFLDDNWYLDTMVDYGALCWLNPPYSNPLPFVKQAIKWSNAGYAVAGILNNDTSTKWYVELKENAQLIMPIVGGRIAFLDGNGDPIAQNNKPQLMFYLAPFGTKVHSVDDVLIDEIYPNGKPKKVKV